MIPAKHNAGPRSFLTTLSPKVVAGGIVFLLLLALVLFLLHYNSPTSPKTPPPAALQSAVAEKLSTLHGGNRYTIASFVPGKPAGADPLRYNATLTARLSDTLYAPVPAVDYIHNQLHLDTSAERKIEQILAAPGGARIRALAGLDATADTLAATQLVRETAHAGARYDFRATLTARRDPAATATNGWRVDITTLTPQTTLPEGEPLAHFSGRRLLDITRESDLAALRRLLAQSNDALRRVEQARDRYRAELAADTARATAAYLALLAPRTLFTGAAVVANTAAGRARSPSAPKTATKKTTAKRGAPANPALPSPSINISLEIQTLDPASTPARLTALLRTDNSWTDTRRLEGPCSYDIETNTLTLTLSAPAGPALTSTTGDVLANAAAFKITLRLTPDAELTGGPPRGWTTRLARVPDAARDATIAALSATAGKLREATRPGTIYRVSLATPAPAQTAKKNLGAPRDTPSDIEMLLRITAQNPRTHAITATLEDTASDWTRELHGTATDNIFRAAGHPIRLASGAAGSGGTGVPPVGLSDMDVPPMQNTTLSSTPQKLTGGTPVPPDPTNATQRITLALRFSATDARALEGTLQTTAPFAITLAPADENYLAQVAAQKTERLRNAAEQARLDHLATHPTLDTLPPADGAYLWRADTGLWLPLPRNDARVARSTMQKIGGIWNAARSLVAKRADKQDTGTLTFEGAAPPPIAPADATASQPIILAYRGPMKIYAGVPPGRIPIEVAPLETKTPAGKRASVRTAELERLGDAAATFGAAAIAATIERPAAPATAAANNNNNIYLVRITRPLPPGRYALAAPDQPFEFEVRGELSR